MQFSRRSLLSGGAAGLAAGLTGVPASGERKFRKRPKNIIFCVADGMALTTVTMCDHYRQITEGKPSYWMTLLNAEYAVSGLQETRSLNSLVTDSSSASGAWGSGRRQWNGQINMYPDGTALRTLVSLMREAGVRCGLVTTATITHATPSGFAINSMLRDVEAQIAEKHLDAGVDILMGGGDKFFSPVLRKDKRDLYADFAKAGYQIVKTKAEMASLGKTNRVLGIFNESHMPYTVDHRNSPELQATRPTLKEMTRAALANLKDAPNGFLLQVEGGRVDHGAHSNDLAALVYDQMAFEEAVEEAVNFALKDKNTLVVITSDHATGGPSLNGSSDANGDSNSGLNRLAGMKASYEVMNKTLGTTPSRGKIQEVFKEQLGIALKNEEAEAVVDAAQKKSPFSLSPFYRSVNGTLAVVLGNYTKVTWTSQSHTSDHVLVSAVGPGRELFAGIRPNTDYFDLMLAAKGLKWENPKMDFETAKKHYQKLKVAMADDQWRQYASHEEDETMAAAHSWRA